MLALRAANFDMSLTFRDKGTGTGSGDALRNKEPAKPCPVPVARLCRRARPYREPVSARCPSLGLDFAEPGHQERHTADHESGNDGQGEQVEQRDLGRGRVVGVAGDAIGAISVDADGFVGNREDNQDDDRRQDQDDGPQGNAHDSFLCHLVFDLQGGNRKRPVAEVMHPIPAPRQRSKRFPTVPAESLTRFSLLAIVDHSAPFTDYTGHRRFLIGNMARGRDNFLVFEGPEGVGKSTGAGNLARDLNPNFSLRYDIIRNTDDLLDRILKESAEDLELRAQGIDPRTSPQVQRRVRMADEAADIFLNRDWSTVESKELLKIGRKTRILRGTWICNTPDLDNLDPWIRNSRVRTRFFYNPFFDSDGMATGPAQVLWKTERFDYAEQRRVVYWTDIYDYVCPSLDKDPEWFSYETDKVHDIQAHVNRLRTRMAQPDQLRRRGLPVPKRKRRGASPPTTT